MCKYGVEIIFEAAGEKIISTVYRHIYILLVHEYVAWERLLTWRREPAKSVQYVLKQKRQVLKGHQGIAPSIFSEFWIIFDYSWKVAFLAKKFGSFRPPWVFFSQLDYGGLRYTKGWITVDYVRVFLLPKSNLSRI